MFVSGRESFYLPAFFLMLFLLTFWHGYGASSLIGSTVVAVSTQSAPEVVKPFPSINIQQISRKFLFGKSEDKKSSPEPVVRRTKLPVSLVGIIAGPDNQSMVLLKIDGRQQAFRVGAKLPLSEGVYVKSVSDAGVIFERATHEESLRFPDRPLVSGLIIND